MCINYVDLEDWIVAGESLAELGKSTIYFDVKVTDETNSKAETAEYVSQAFIAFKKLLGNLHEESYETPDSVDATAHHLCGSTCDVGF